jgi:hypothetical protein
VDPSSRTRRRFLRDAGLAGAAASAIPLAEPFVGFAGAETVDYPAGVSCPHPNPIVHENWCTDHATFSEGFRVATTYSEITGYARTPSVDVGHPVELVISGPNLYLPDPPEAPVETVEIELYRLGYYGGKGGRKVWSTTGPVSTWQKLDAQGRPTNSGTLPPAGPVDAHTGLAGRKNDRTIVTVPGSALKTSGVYLAKLKGKWIEFPPGTSSVIRSGESHIVFTVRDDSRVRDLLVLLPTNTWQAYNYPESRSLYTNLSRYNHAGDLVPATGTERAAKVSLDRAYNNWGGETNWVLRTEFPAIWWLERHGYDVAYTEDVALSFAPEQALPSHSRGVAILGHGEYWSDALRSGIQGARDAGTSIYNFGANTSFWKVRHEQASGAPATSVENARVMVCYKTIEGGAGDQPTVSSEADPVAPTTTWRDPGKGAGVAVPGTTQATPATYAGPNRPEAELFGVQYSGADDGALRPLTVPADNGAGEFAGHRAWRYTTVPAAGATIGTNLLGWEWDGIPATTGRFGGTPPATKAGTGGIRRLAQSDPSTNPPAHADTQYLVDAGRVYSTPGPTSKPAAGESPYAHAVTYTAPSGAFVFSAGTILWAWGLGPHYLNVSGNTYADPATNDADARIIQATANLFADGGIVPLTPDGLKFDPPPTPEPDPVPDDGGTVVTAPPASTDTGTATPPAQTPETVPTKPLPIPALTFSLDRARATKTGKFTGRVRAATAVPRTIHGTVEMTLARKRIAHATFTITASRSGVVTLKLSRTARLLLTRKGSLKPLGRVIVTENGKTLRTDLVRLTLRSATKK